jgi:hypothetical protein
MSVIHSQNDGTDFHLDDRIEKCTWSTRRSPPSLSLFPSHHYSSSHPPQLTPTQTHYGFHHLHFHRREHHLHRSFPPSPAPRLRVLPQLTPPCLFRSPTPSTTSPSPLRSSSLAPPRSPTRFVHPFSPLHLVSLLTASLFTICRRSPRVTPTLPSPTALPLASTPSETSSRRASSTLSSSLPPFFES